MSSYTDGFLRGKEIGEDNLAELTSGNWREHQWAVEGEGDSQLANVLGVLYEAGYSDEKPYDSEYYIGLREGILNTIRTPLGIGQVVYLVGYGHLGIYGEFVMEGVQKVTTAFNSALKAMNEIGEAAEKMFGTEVHIGISGPYEVSDE